VGQESLLGDHLESSYQPDLDFDKDRLRIIVGQARKNRVGLKEVRGKMNAEENLVIRVG